MMELNLKNAAALTCLKQAERLYPTLAGIKGWLALAMVYVGGDVACLSISSLRKAPVSIYSLYQ